MSETPRFTPAQLREMVGMIEVAMHDGVAAIVAMHEGDAIGEAALDTIADMLTYAADVLEAQQQQNGDLIERLAAWDHNAWAGWTEYMLDNLTPENIARWRVLIDTAYADLPEHSKESDRNEAREILGVLAGEPERTP